MLAKVTIIGRPNVGKSSFFNMYTGHKIAIVDDTAGTTRDISEYEYYDEKHELTYIVADSGGLDFGSKDDEVADDIIMRTEAAIAESDLLVWVIEYDRFTELDTRISSLIRKYKADNFIVVANKADNEDMIMQSYSEAGKGELEFFPASTSHNKGIADVKRFVAKYLTKRGLNYKIEEEQEGTIKLALLGRPNVGKSSLINAITGKDRVMVKDQSGTTRDSIDTKFTHDGNEFVLIDTAGIRRLSKIGTRNVENWSVMRSERALKRADIIGVVVDGFDGIVQQDLSIISRAQEEKKGIIIIVNKWDKVLNKATAPTKKSLKVAHVEADKVDPEAQEATKAHMMERYIAYLQEKIEFLPWVTVIFTSATDKKRVDEILKRAVEIHTERFKRVKTSIINNFLEQVIYKHPPTGNKKSHSPKIYYGSQVTVNPPKFVFTVSNPDHFHFSYKRYLENKIRDNFGFHGTPMTLEYRGRGKHAGKVK